MVPNRKFSMGSSFEKTVTLGNNAGQGLWEGWPVSQRTLVNDKGRSREFNFH